MVSQSSGRAIDRLKSHTVTSYCELLFAHFKAFLFRVLRQISVKHGGKSARDENQFRNIKQAFFILSVLLNVSVIFSSRDQNVPISTEGVDFLLSDFFLCCCFICPSYVATVMSSICFPPPWSRSIFGRYTVYNGPVLALFLHRKTVLGLIPGVIANLNDYLSAVY